MHACTFMYELTSQQAAANAEKDQLVVHTFSGAIIRHQETQTGVREATIYTELKEELDICRQRQGTK